MNLKQITQKAFNLHSNGNFSEAEKIYKDLLQICPEDINVLNLYGMLCLQLRQFDKAISLLSRAVVLGDSAYIMSNLGKAYLYSGETKQAIKIFEDAKELEQPNDDLLYSLAIAYKEIGNYKKAINAYKSALDFNPNNYNVCYNLALLLATQGNINDAINYASKCLLISPDSEEIYVMLAGFYEEINDIDLAILNWEKATSVNPKQAVYFYNLGVLYSKVKNQKKAIQAYSNSLFIEPNYIESLINLSLIYKDINLNQALELILKAYYINPNEKNVVLNLAQIQRDLFNNDESIRLLQNFIKNNDSHEAYSLLGINYMDMGEYNKALDYYEKALKFEPKNPNYLHSKSTALKYLGNINESRKILEEVVSNNPHLIQSAISLGMFYLQQKDFKNGMPLYMKRSFDTNFSKLFAEKIWNKNTDLKDKKVLVYTDCGLGDTLMFSRYLPYLSEIAKSVSIQTDKEITSILSESFCGIKVFSKTQLVNDYDVVIPIMNLPYSLGMDFNKIPYSDKYLNTSKKFNIEKLNNTKLKVGLCFEGNKKIFKNRLIPSSFITQLLNIDNAVFYTFKNQLEGTVSLDEYIKDYSDTASILKQMDLLITIDSSIVHMAGALGVKTFLLLPFTAEWRWFDDNKSTPWYNSVEIFKQDNIGDWQPIIDSVKEKLINNDIK